MTDEQGQALFDRQMELLHTFLEHGTITKAQFLKSSTDLNAKMFPETRAKNGPPPETRHWLYGDRINNKGGI